jgi:hypothetical protein
MKTVKKTIKYVHSVGPYINLISGSSSKPIEEGNTSYEGASSTISGSDTEQIENDSTKLED